MHTIRDTRGLRWNENKGVPYLTDPAMEKISFLRHAFSTRLGGVSPYEFESMNLSLGRGDSDENVLENYRLFCGAVGLDDSSLVASAQDHHTVVRRVTKQDAGIGIWKPKDRASVDGLITNEPGVTLVIHTADCVPILFCDPVNRAVGAAHAGWRGTVKRMAGVMVEAMAREFGSKPGDLLAVIGPSIGPECYEVDSPVAEQFRAMRGLPSNTFIEPRGDGKFMLNLWEVNRLVLMEAGVPEASITVGGLCTQCNAEWLFSHRASGGRRGGLASFIAMREDA